MSGTVHVVVPAGVADPRRPSGGNTYDRRVCAALADAGWSVGVVEVAGAWPSPGRAGRDALAAALGAVPDGGLVLVDGLVASGVPEVVVPAAARLDLVVLLHMPLGIGATDDRVTGAERAVLGAASSVVTPSHWCRGWLLDAYGLDPARVHVAHPGVDPAALATGTRDGGALLCVGAVTPAKGHDLLLEALVSLADLRWHCVCVGALRVAPEFATRLRRRAHETGLAHRFLLTGPRSGAALAAAYDAADVLVLASRAETYGMVVAEALARGLPVIAGDAGGVSEALGATADGRLPGVLVPAGDAAALADRLHAWLDDDDLRSRLRLAAAERRTRLTGWAETAEQVGRVLQCARRGVAA